MQTLVLIAIIVVAGIVIAIVAPMTVDRDCTLFVGTYFRPGWINPLSEIPL